MVYDGRSSEMVPQNVEMRIAETGNTVTNSFSILMCAAADGMCTTVITKPYSANLRTT
jgi:hypothetical protein